MKLSKYEYYRTENGVLYCGDNKDIMELMKPKIKLCLTDPPYGIDMDKGFSGSDGFSGKGKVIKRRKYNDKWDCKIPEKIIFNLMFFLSIDIIIFGGNHFTELLPVGKHWLVWDKKNTMPTFSDCELIYTNIGRKSVMKYEVEYNGLIGKEKFRDHPTQKPVKLIQMILKDYSKENDLIFDPFFGSGTLGVACEKLKRKWIGIEINEKYCEIAKKRIKAENDQLKMGF